MNASVLKKLARFIASTGSVLTMIFAPVAQGASSQDNLQKQLESFLNETQLNKRVTYKEFWNKTKHLYSGQVFFDMERYFMSNPNELMPEVSVKESLSSTGEKIPTMTISEKGKSHTIQFFGEKTKFAKFNNVVLTENDLMLVTPAMKRVTASDIKIKKDHDKKINKVNKEQFSGFPALDQNAWKKMNQKERAMYILLMRQTWDSARKVLEVSPPPAIKEEAKKKKTSRLENFLRLFKPDVWASGKNGDGCLVAGYISEYQGGVCSVKAIAKHYDANEPLVKKSMEYCSTKSAGTISCNPYVYGAPNGSPTCVTPSRTDANFQRATHAKGPCDTASPLGKPSDFKFLINDKITGPERYADSNLVKGADGKALSLEDEFKKQQADNAEYVESYLKGILKFNNGKEVNFSEALDNDTLRMITEIKEQFDLEITQARDNCRADASKKHEKNFWEACDQMQRRFLNVAEFLSKKPGCPGNVAVNPRTLRCPCEDGGDANPGAQCVAVEERKTGPSDTTTVTESIDCGAKFPGLGTVSSEDGKSCLCENGKEPSGEPAKCSAGFNWKPWLIGAGILAAVGFLWYRHNKKKDRNPSAPPPPTGCQTSCAAIYTQNPVTCACEPIVQPPTCQAPLDPITCACPATNACTPGQQVYNLQTCQCDNVVQPGICPDGVTQYFTPPGPSSCPAGTLCQNGTTVYPPNTCPPVDEGGSGNSCPNNDCSGGVPTSN